MLLDSTATTLVSAPPVSPHRRLTALVWAFLLGAVGAHRFYVRRYRSGLLMLILTFSFYGALIAAIWSLVDCVLILNGRFTDAAGHPLRREGVATRADADGEVPSSQ